MFYSNQIIVIFFELDVKECDLCLMHKSCVSPGVSVTSRVLLVSHLSSVWRIKITSNQ